MHIEAQVATALKEARERATKRGRVARSHVYHGTKPNERQARELEEDLLDLARRLDNAFAAIRRVSPRA